MSMLVYKFFTFIEIPVSYKVSMIELKVIYLKLS